MATHSLKIKKTSSHAGFVRQTIQSDLLEGVVNIPRSLKHRLVEVILLPLDTSREQAYKSGSLPLAHFAGSWAGDPLVREEQGIYEVREKLT